jgi:hypothetical protein
MMDDMLHSSANLAADAHDPATRRRPVATETRGLRGAIADGKLPPGPRARRTDCLTQSRIRHGYAAMTHELKARYKISIRKWRRHMSGVAYELVYRDGRIKRLITAPRPRSPVSAAIFLHEVGHHAIGFRRYSPRCLEEFYVWQWALREMASRNIPITPRVLRHYHRSMHHYVRQARKHHPHHIPDHLHPFLNCPG